jgi:hypothetical protein
LVAANASIPSFGTRTGVVNGAADGPR